MALSSQRFDSAWVHQLFLLKKYDATMIDILIIQHESDTPPGTTLEWAKSRGLSTATWQISEASTPPLSFENFKALVVCGGSMDTFEDDRFPWLKIEKEFLKNCINLKKPIFGLCLGSQLLAEVLGGKVYPMNKWEVGFIPVQMMDQSSEYNLNVFHWHQCTFDLPPTAKLMATNDFCANQAFTFGDRIVATQFHPESTREWILECAESVTEDLQGLVQSKNDIIANLALQEPLKNWFFQKLDSWFARA